MFRSFFAALLVAACITTHPAAAQMKKGEMEPGRLSTLMAHVLFKTVCVDNFGSSNAVRSWADHYMRAQDENDEPVKTNDIADVWAQGSSVGGFVLRLTEDPWNCMVSAQNGDTAEVHAQMKGLADEIDRNGIYRTELFENMHQESNTRYSMLRMISETENDLVIIASTNPNRDIKINYSISEETSNSN